jgi:hypothetical protein
VRKGVHACVHACMVRVEGCASHSCGCAQRSKAVPERGWSGVQALVATSTSSRLFMSMRMSRCIVTQLIKTVVWEELLVAQRVRTCH